MTAGSAVRLLILAAIWGGSFLFMRIGAPVLGPAWLVQCRVGIAALFLLICAVWLRKPLQLRQYWRHYLIVGCFNSALPFFLIGFAAKTLTASLLSVLNSSSPIFGAIISAVWLRHRISKLSAAGLAMGVIGVIILVQDGIASRADDWGLAVAAALLSTIFYGISGTYVKASPKPIEPFSNAHGSMWAATVLMALTLPFYPAATEPTLGVWAAVAALGVLCTGVAYLIYFRLVQDMGPISALSVTFLVPVFGILWGVLFLDEQIGWSTVIGAVVVLAGTALTNGITPRFFLESAKNCRARRPERLL